MIVEMKYYECWVCGVQFGLSVAFANAATCQHTTFFCPRGCRLAFGPSQLDQLQKDKDAMQLDLQAKLNQASHAKLVAEKERDKALRDKRKVERRVAHGVCPCCNKTFADLSNHMISEHKDFRLPGGKKPREIAAPAV